MGEVKVRATELTEEQQQELDLAFEKARKALAIIETYDQERVDRLCQAVAWAVANKKTFARLVEMGIEESRLGDPESRMNKRFKIRGILRDALRQKSIGIIEEIPEKGIVKYAKPVGIIASIVPTTNPDLTPAGTAIYAIKARDVVIYSPHPRSKKTSFETVRLMREALEREGAPADILQCLTNVNIPMTKALMARADLALATGGKDMVKSAYSSGTPAYGVGAGNATMIIDETADTADAAKNTMLSKTSDFGSGCSSDGNLIISDKIFDDMLEQLQKVGGYLANEEEKAKLRAVMWDDEGHRLPTTVALAPQKLAEIAGFSIPDDRKFIIVRGDKIGKEYPFSGEKLTTLLAVYKYEGEFENALDMMRAVYEVGGKGHSCGIYSFNDDHIHRLGMAAPVSRIMVRQPQSKANAGAFNNGMPMTSSLGCGTWGGNIVSENVHLKHYMNTTWVSRPIPEDKPSDEELFGEFFDPELEK
ncbi:MULTISPECIES: aldehyde dehydrogenase family protein [Brevibacillus]|uniref:aldehyde dehydrogenase family protein n=1 Tax=Brevibacillus TaxID=55080 RepID=UPI00203A6D55|nr:MULTISPECIES: aldehyde dehydrogenase family protein [Brevibacillus]MCM3078291.1 aldehyde dehydrogenase family protein [Brevibacillus invocatus]MCM3428554.1 aldehyde dehydrogenase family protein [Brevibacillus invocatus]MDH4616927.1 aldehyde dehydrogenase family protein [Brevibacillus sp. AY1]